MLSRKKKEVYLLGASSFFNDIGSEMITPMVPLFINSLGGGGLSIGLISGLREGLSSLLKLFGGWFSDRIGRRKGVVFFGYIFSFLMKVLISISQTSLQLMSFVSLERIGKMRDAPRDAIIAHLNKQNGKNFGIHDMLDKAGGFFGTVFVILFFIFFGFNFKSIVLLAAGISAFSIIPLFFVKDKKTEPIKMGLFRSLSSLDPHLKKIIFFISMFSFANFGLYMFFILKVKEVTGSIIIPLILYAIFTLICAVFSEKLGKYADHSKKEKIIVSGYVLFALICIGFATLHNFALITLLFFAYGIVFAMTEPVQKALVSEFSGETKGTAMGAYHFARGIATIFGGLIAGIIWNYTENGMFFYLSTLGLISAIMFFVHSKNVHKE